MWIECQGCQERRGASMEIARQAVAAFPRKARGAPVQGRGERGGLNALKLAASFRSLPKRIGVASEKAQWQCVPRSRFGAGASLRNQRITASPQTWLHGARKRAASCAGNCLFFVPLPAMHRGPAPLGCRVNIALPLKAPAAEHANRPSLRASTNTTRGIPRNQHLIR